MNVKKQRKKLLALMVRAEQAINRQESKEILKKVKKIAKKIARKSEI